MTYIVPPPSLMTEDEVIDAKRKVANIREICNDVGETLLGSDLYVEMLTLERQIQIYNTQQLMNEVSKQVGDELVKFLKEQT